jgi:hypothetical protein
VADLLGGLRVLLREVTAMKKRSKYKPKGVRLDNMAWVQSGLKRVDEVSASATIKIRNHDAMNTLRLGSATRAEIDIIINALNIAEALAQRGVGSDWMPELRAAQDALYTLARRGLTSRFIVRGDELTALNLAMEIHDAQLETVTVRQLEAALNFVNETVRLKKARPIVETV